jgi:hypothetical protein
MKYFLVKGKMFNKIVMANNESEVNGEIIRELTKEEVKEYTRSF